MKLYFSKGACSLVPRIVINELNLKCDYVSVNLGTKQTETGKDFYTINPKGSVPVIQLDSGEILTENAVILQYLADTAHAKELLPTVGDLKRYRILEWLNYVATELHKGIGILFNSNLPQEIKDKVFIPLIKSKVTFVDRHLKENTYLSGDYFTLPDAYCFVMLTWLAHFNFNFAEWPNASRYFKELKERKSIVKSLQEEGLRIPVT